jgi:hypothetical protein
MIEPTRATVILALGLEKIARDAGLTPYVAPSAEGGMAVMFVESERAAAVEFYNDGDQLGVTSDRVTTPAVWEFVALPDAVERIAAFLGGQPR